MNEVIGVVGGPWGRTMSRGANSARASRRFFPIASALLFAASLAATIDWCAFMSAMGEMTMPGGWTMSTAWMRMPGHTWLDVVASLVCMWMVMMPAMMLPSIVPTLSRCRIVGRRGVACASPSTVLVVAAAYFLVWATLGMVVLPLGIVVAVVELRSPALARAVPIAAGAVVLMAGALQLTTWKARHLACCRETQSFRTLTANARKAFRHGLRIGLHCSQSCLSFVAMLLVFGVMDLRAMMLVTAAITAERLAPNSQRVARATGAVAIGAGLFLMARAVLIT